MKKKKKKFRRESKRKGRDRGKKGGDSSCAALLKTKCTHAYRHVCITF